MSDSYKRFVTYSCWVAIALFAFRCLLAQGELLECVNRSTWGSLVYDILGFAGEAISLAALVMVVFNKWAWKWKCINWFLNMPVLAKSYKGAITSNWLGEIKEHNAFLDVEQTFLSVSINFKTDESRSHSTLAAIDTSGNPARLIYVYQNEPKGELVDRSARHVGEAELLVNESGELSGNYFTSRKTAGSMSFTPQ